MAATFKPRLLPDVDALMRISGLEPLNYTPEPKALRKTFLNIGHLGQVQAAP